jgi:hypothetical protein
MSHVSYISAYMSMLYCYISGVLLHVSAILSCCIILYVCADYAILLCVRCGGVCVCARVCMCVCGVRACVLCVSVSVCACACACACVCVSHVYRSTDIAFYTRLGFPQAQAEKVKETCNTKRDLPNRTL